MPVKKATLYTIAFIALCVMFWGVYFLMKTISEMK